MSNSAASAPPVIVNVGRDRPHRVRVRRGQGRHQHVFSATDCGAAVVITGALSFTSVRLTVIVLAVVLAPSSAVTCTS